MDYSDFADMFGGIEYNSARREIDEAFGRAAERRRDTRLWLIEAELARLIDDVQKNRNRPEENA